MHIQRSRQDLVPGLMIISYLIAKGRHVYVLDINWTLKVIYRKPGGDGVRTVSIGGDAWRRG